MKKLYKTPEVTVEEISKQDVLCESLVKPTYEDNSTLLSYMWGVVSGEAF